MTTLELIKTTYAVLPTEHQKQIIWLILGMILVIFFELALAGMISLMGVALAAPQTLTTMVIIKDIVPHIPFPQGVSPTIGMLTLTLLLVTLSAICKNIMTAYITYKQLNIAQTLAWNINFHIFKNYLFAPYRWHLLQNTAALQTQLTWRVQMMLFLHAAFNAVSYGVIMLCLLLVAFLLSPLISLLLFGTCGIIGMLTYVITQKKIRLLGNDLVNIQVETDKLSHFALQGMREVHIYSQRQKFYEQYIEVGKEFPKVFAIQQTFPHTPLWILESLGFMMLLCTVMLLQWQGSSIALITGTVTLMAGISWRLLPNMNKCVHAILHMKTYFAYAEKIIQNNFNIEQEEVNTHTYTLHESIELKDVGFSYPQAEKKALDAINIHITKGSMVGLVGLSGAGKSTLVGVLTGLLPPTQGDIFIDGVKVPSAPGYMSIGYVPQSPYIMDATLAQNVAFSDWGKTIDEERVKKCCALAAMGFIDDLPGGIHTMLGDRGMRLSGGQVQRVAIARALYTQPDVLLFDEATSALDGATEAEIQETILSLRKDLTIVMVAHRLSTVEGCDSVYWLHEGKVRSGVNSSHLLEEYELFLAKNNV